GEGTPRAEGGKVPYAQGLAGPAGGPQQQVASPEAFGRRRAEGGRAAHALAHGRDLEPDRERLAQRRLDEARPVAQVQARRAQRVPQPAADLAEVWILCDVYENDLKDIHTGEFADIHIDAYPNLVLKGRVSDIGPVLDPNIRTAKVRLQVANPGVLRIGMFVTATFHSLRKHEL
ncbi:HlyD family efflux transporter periplasmic adaptor subunit, partial [Lacticaseibacillus rhamnosus]